MKSPQVGEHELGFWLRHVRIGVSISQLTLAVCMVYVLRYANPERRLALIVLVGIAFVATLGVNFLPLPRILTSVWAVPFFGLWSGLLTLLIVLGSVGDGGGDTPLVFLYFMPVVYGAIAYPPLGVIALGIVVVSAAVITHTLGGGTFEHTLMLGATLALVTTMCAVSARNHWRATRTQASLAGRLAHLANHDGLTGCLNHRAFHQRLDEAAEHAAATRAPLALLMVDLDDFKLINDTHGHPIGDGMLHAVGRLLRATTRETDDTGRIGGDEFAVLMPDTDPDTATTMAEAIRRAIGTITDPVPITASVGVSTMPHPARDAASLLHFADRATYRAKRSGRDYVSVYGEEPQPRGTDQVDRVLHTRVLELVAGRHLRTVFQPVVSLQDGSVIGYEALSRIDNSNLGPSQWLDLAAQVGVRDQLEAAMWRQALAAGAPPDGKMLFLNASPAALLSGAFDECRDLLPAASTIEVSEHEPIADYALLTRDLADWVDAGCSIAVDDMGAGHANLAHVLNLAPHYLKLDRSLVADVHEHPSRIALLESLLTFASRIGSRIIAEGVETEEEAATLWRVGVRYAQGHLFARPAPPWVRVDWRPPLIAR